MRSIFLHIISFAAGALVCYLVLSNQKEKPSPEYLFLVNATATKDAVPQGDATRVLTLDASEVMTFTDRPYHRASPITPKDLQAILKQMIEDEKNPPNASLVVFHENKNDVVDTAIVEIVEAKLQGNSVFTMKVTRVDDGAAATQAALPDVTLGTHVSLTIDNFGKLDSDSNQGWETAEKSCPGTNMIDRTAYSVTNSSNKCGSGTKGKSKACIDTCCAVNMQWCQENYGTVKGFLNCIGDKGCHDNLLKKQGLLREMYLMYGKKNTLAGAINGYDTVTTTKTEKKCRNGAKVGFWPGNCCTSIINCAGSSNVYTQTNTVVRDAWKGCKYYQENCGKCYDSLEKAKKECK